MKLFTPAQIYNVLQNLNHIENSYVEYSNRELNFINYQTYMDFFQNTFIKSNDLAGFYFPIVPSDFILPKRVTEYAEVTDNMTIRPQFDFAVYKSFTLKNAIRHVANYFTGIFILEGNAEIEFDDLTLPLNEYDFLLIPPQIYYAFEAMPNSICLYYNIKKSFLIEKYTELFMGEPTICRFILESARADSIAKHLILHIKDENSRQALKDIVLSIYLEQYRNDKYSPKRMTHLLYLFFTTYLRDETLSITSSIAAAKTDVHFAKILDYIENNFQHASLTKASAALDFSKQYLCRIVKEKTGNSFLHLLTERKLSVAMDYLQNTDLSLEAVAELSGFCDASVFSKVFKKYKNMPPSEFRKMLRG